MADRDALIVICWLVILILVFFECFHRKLKARFSRDIQPPQSHRQSLTSFPSDAATIGGFSTNGQSFGGSFRRGDPQFGSAITFSNRGARFSGPIAIATSTSTSVHSPSCGSTKEVCRIPMMMMMMSSGSNGEEEEPPPTYEMAMRLCSKFNSPPLSPAYEESSSGSESVVVQCEDSNVAAQIDGDNQNSNINANSCGGGAADGTNNRPTTSSTSMTMTTAIFIGEEESEEDSEEETDDYSSAESMNDSGDDELDQRQVPHSNVSSRDEVKESAVSESERIIKQNMINSQESCSTGMQCNGVGVILSSASSTSKNLDTIGMESSQEKIKLTTTAAASEKERMEFLSEALPPKLRSPPSSPGNVNVV